ncbi:hypothetical protein HDU99_010467, partial [Rhizoclosmatium hyalinum]
MSASASSEALVTEDSFLTATTAAIESKEQDASPLGISDDVKEDQPAVVLTNFQFFLVFVGLALAVFVVSLDMTIISVALQVIASEFDSLNQINWVGTAYFLTSTAFIPVYGQLSDVFGRKSVFLLAITIFEIGSLLCGVSTSMNMLIASRGIAGLGGSGIFSLTMIIIGDLTTARDRG